MTIHEQTVRAEIIAVQIGLLNDTLAMVNFPTIEWRVELVKEVLRLSKLIQ